MIRARLRPCCTMLAVALGIARNAHAADVQAVRFELVGPPSCAGSARLSAEVRARTGRVRAATSDEMPDLTLRVHVERDGRTFQGTLVLTGSNGSATRRTLSGETCEAVTSSLALVAALAIDPAASTAEGLPLGSLDVATDRGPPPAPAPPPPAALPMPPPLPDPLPPLIPAVLPPPLAAPAEERALLAAPARGPSPFRWRPTFGLDAGIFGVGAPGVVGEGDLFVDLARESASAFSPSFRLSVHRTLETSASVTGGSATFAWTFGRAEGCPFRLGPTSGLAVRPCAFVDAGTLAASGQAPENARSTGRPWAAAGALGRLEWAHDLSRQWALVVEAQAGIVFPVVRETFNFAPSATLYEAPLVSGLGAIGVGMRFL